jgi:hypothetical protein
MSTRRRFEAACGLIAAVIGLALLIIIFLGLPFYYQTISSSGTGSRVNAFPAGVQLLVFVVFGLLLLGLVGEGLGATLHSRTGGNRWRVLLWVSTAAMVVIPVFTLLNIGLALLPSTLFALVACALSLGTRRAALS